VEAGRRHSPWRRPRQGHQAAASSSQIQARPAQAPAFEQRVDDREQGGGEQHGPGEVGPPGRPLPGLRDEPYREGQGDHRDGHVDEEHRAPAPAEQVSAGEDAAQEQADGRGEAEDRAVKPERLPALGAVEDGAERGQQLRRHHRRGRTLDDPGRDQLARHLGQARGEVSQAEGDDSGQEQALAPEQIAEADQLLIAVVNGFTLDETADEQPGSDAGGPSQGAARDYIASLPLAQFPNLTAVAGEFSGVDQDGRFELLLDLFVGGLARRVATDESRAPGRSK